MHQRAGLLQYALSTGNTHTHTHTSTPYLRPPQILAPTDDAFETLLRQLGGGGRRLPLDLFFQLPELPDILQYHVVPGLYTTGG